MLWIQICLVIKYVQFFYIKAGKCDVLKMHKHWRIRTLNWHPELREEILYNFTWVLHGAHVHACPSIKRNDLTSNTLPFNGIAGVRQRWWSIDAVKILGIIAKMWRLGCFVKLYFLLKQIGLPTTYSALSKPGWLKIYNVKMVNEELARGPPKLCRNQKSFWILKD